MIVPFLVSQIYSKTKWPFWTFTTLKISHMFEQRSAKKLLLLSIFLLTSDKVNVLEGRIVSANCSPSLSSVLFSLHGYTHLGLIINSSALTQPEESLNKVQPWLLMCYNLNITSLVCLIPPSLFHTWFMRVMTSTADVSHNSRTNKSRPSCSKQILCLSVHLQSRGIHQAPHLSLLCLSVWVITILLAWVRVA